MEVEHDESGAGLAAMLAAPSPLAKRHSGALPAETTSGSWKRSHGGLTFVPRAVELPPFDLGAFEAAVAAEPSHDELLVMRATEAAAAKARRMKRKSELRGDAQKRGMAFPM